MQAAIKAVPTLIPVMRLIPENTASTGATPKAESRSKATAIPAQTVPRIRIPQLRGLLKGDDCTRPVCTRLCAQGYKASGVEHRGMRCGGVWSCEAVGDCRIRECRLPHLSLTFTR